MISGSTYNERVAPYRADSPGRCPHPSRMMSVRPGATMQEPREPIRQELLTWDDVDRLMDVLLGQLRQAGQFDAVVLITRGGVIPGGMVCEALDIRWVLTAAVRFPSQIGT